MDFIVTAPKNEFASVYCCTVILNSALKEHRFLPIYGDLNHHSINLKDIFNYELINLDALKIRFKNYIPFSELYVFENLIDIDNIQTLYFLWNYFNKINQESFLKEKKEDFDKITNKKDVITGKIICLGKSMGIPGLVASTIKSFDYEIVDDFEEIIKHIQNSQQKYLILLLPKECMSTQQLECLAYWQYQSTSLIGIITAQDISTFFFLLAKIFLFAKKIQGRYLLIGDNIQEVCNPPIEHINLDELSSIDLKKLTQELSNSMCMSIHGDNIDGDLGLGVLCGRTMNYTTYDNAKPVIHTCMLGNYCRRNVDGTKQLIPITTLKTKFLFTESCSGISVNNSIFPHELSLAAGALNGWCIGYLSSIRISKNTPFGLLFVHTLLVNGCSFGEVAKLISLYHKAETDDIPCFLLLGDPSFRVNNGRILAQYIINIEEPLQNIQLNLDTSEFIGNALKICLQGCEAQKFSKIQQLKISFGQLDELSNPLQMIVLKNFDGFPLTIFIISTENFKCKNISIIIKEKSNVYDDLLLKLGKETIDSLDFLEYIKKKAETLDGLRDTPELTKQCKDITNATYIGNKALLLIRSELSSDMAASAYYGESSNTITNRSKIDQLINDSDSILATEWASWKMPHYFIPFYKGYLHHIGTESKTSDKCGYCNNDIYETTMADFLHRNIQRIISICPLCGIVSDRPISETLTFIDGPSFWKSGEPFIQEISLSNNKYYDKRYYFGVSFEGNYPWFHWKCEPSIPSIQIKHGETGHMKISITSSNHSLPGVYYLMCNIISNLTMHLIVKPIQLIQ